MKKERTMPSEAPEQSTSKFRSLWERLIHDRNSFIRYGGFAVVLLVFALSTGGRLFSSYNLKVLMSQITPLLIMSVGMVFIFAHGGMDISVGAVSGLCSLVSVYVLNATGSVLAVLLVSILLAVLCYSINCLISELFGLMSTISSLAIMFAARGMITFNVAQTSEAIRIQQTKLLSVFSDSYLFMALACVLAVLMTWFLFSFTKLGKQARAIGDNPLSARQSGANVNLVKLLCYVVAGVCIGFASVFSIARVGSVSENIGSGREMDVIIAVILGGMTLSGGCKSRISSAVIGSITFVLLSNGLSLSGVSSLYVSLIKGALFLIIVFLTLRQNKNVPELPR